MDVHELPADLAAFVQQELQSGKYTSEAEIVCTALRLLRERERLRLGSVIAVDQTVPEEICRRAVKAAKALRRHAEDARVDQLLPVATAGGPDDAYREQGSNKFPLRTLLTPLEQTANLCQMRYIPPFVLFASLKALEKA